MTRTATCAACDSRPAPNATICTQCRQQLERNLGDIGALILEAARVYRTDDVTDDGDPRNRGTDERPLVTSRRRRLIPKINPRTGDPVNDDAGKPVMILEPFQPGEHGRTSPVPWDADHGLGRDIEISLARQAALGKREGPRGSGRPLPFSTRASKVAHDATVRLDHWVRVLHVDGEPWPVPDVAAQSRWLLSRLTRAVAHAGAAEFDRDVTRVVTQIRYVIDRPADRWYAGPCDTDGCVEQLLTFDDDGRPRREARPSTLYADPELDVVTCRQCGARYDVEERRAWLLAAAEDQLAHAELIGRAAPALGVEITPAAVRNYAARGRISAHGTDLQGRPLYRVGDVIDVAQDVLAKKAEAREKREAKDREKSKAGSRRSA